MELRRVEMVVNGMSNSITYILPVGVNGECWLVDCGDVEKVLDAGWTVRGVLITHAHIDHIYGLNNLIERYPDVLVYTCLDGREGLLNPRRNFSKYRPEIENFVLKYPENIRLFDAEGTYYIGDDIKVQVLFTPGHDVGCLSYRVDDIVFTGDAYIKGEKTNVGFPRSNKEDAERSLSRLKDMEASGLRMLCGHPNRTYEAIAQRTAALCGGCSLPTQILVVKAKEAMWKADCEGRDAVEALAEFLGIDKQYVV